MPSELKTMKGVYIHYWNDGASTMIYASESNVEPTGQYSSHANPGKDLINEVLDKVKANNDNPSVPIKLRIVNDTYIVRDIVPLGGGPQAPALAAPKPVSLGQAEDVELDEEGETAPKEPAPKPKAATTKAGTKKPAKKKPGAPKSKVNTRRR